MVGIYVVRLVGWCKDCDHALAPPPGEWGPVTCPECGRVYELDPSPGVRAGEPDRCAVCGWDRLHLRKDFPRQLGLAIVLVAAVLTFTNACPPGFFWVPLVVASLVDLALYQVIPWKIVCYVCEAEYRGAKLRPELEPFDLHEATECKRLKWPKPRVAPPA